MLAKVGGPFVSRPQKDGTTFEYGGGTVTLVECEECHGVYSDGPQHITTDYHKAAVA